MAWIARSLPILVLIGGLSATGASVFALRQAAVTRDRLTFLHATDIEIRTIKDQFGTYTALLRGTAGLFAARSGHVTLGEFRAYVDRIKFPRLYPGVLGIGYTPSVPQADKERLAAEARELGVENFRIHPATDNPTVAAVVFAEPPNPRNQAAIGFDVLSDPVRREMVERARDTGRPSATAPIHLVQEIDRNKQPGFLVATPLYDGGSIPDTLDERRARFRGFIFGAFRADDLFGAIVSDEPRQDAAFAVYDGPVSGGALLHRSSGAGDPEAAAYVREAQIGIAGRTWTVVFQSRERAGIALGGPESWVVGIGGLLATGLLALATGRQRRTQDALNRLNASLEERVEARTLDLRSANERLREAGEERARMEDRIRQSQKMEAVGQLTGGLAHDFNNLLAAVSGALELMGSRLANGRIGEVAGYMEVARTATTRAAALTHRLLAFSRRQTLEAKPTDVDGLVEGMVDMIRRTVGPAVDVVHIATPGLWPALVDPPQLENALLNLCINARDAMPDGGRIAIRTGNVAFGTAEAARADIPVGEYLVLSVTDTGTGMAPDVLARAFDPFFTTKPIGQGTGLGLSMIYGFAQQSGGQVSIESEPGRGTRVSIHLPRHHGALAAAPAPSEEESEARASAGETVLVVDDEPAVRMLVRDILEEKGYAAIEAGDGASGLRVLESGRRVDLLVTDVGLPGGMNGRQLADAARVGRPDLKVLFITGYAESAVLGNGTLPAGMTVMTKPFALDALAARVEGLIAA